MTQKEIVTALRCCAEGECRGCTIHNDKQRCQERVLDAAADLIENQQRHIEALMKANAALRDIVRCDRAGVFFGAIKEHRGTEATMTNVRKLWYWNGACAVLHRRHRPADAVAP